MPAVLVNKIDRFLQLMLDRGASDLHLSVGRSPMFRLSGEIDPIRYRVLTNRDYAQFIKPIVPEPSYWERYLTTGDCDFSYEVKGLARFRVNCFMQEMGFGAVFRVIPTKLMTVAQLGLPPAVSRICNMTRGLVLVTGPTGSGKSTTLSAIINQINADRKLHIITIEDPIEFVHPPQKSVITQREIGPHARNVNDALRAAVREDPDLILVGEMRDVGTISLALSAAASGLLVFGTLHTNSAAKTVDRIINVFPVEEQDAVRSIMAETLQAVLAQQLLKKVGGGRVAAVEIMFGGGSLPALIREGKTHQISSFILQGKRQGMVNMDAALLALMQSGRITEEAAYEKAIDKADFRKHLTKPIDDEGGGH